MALLTPDESTSLNKLRSAKGQNTIDLKTILTPPAQETCAFNVLDDADKLPSWAATILIRKRNSVAWDKIHSTWTLAWKDLQGQTHYTEVGLKDIRLQTQGLNNVVYCSKSVSQLRRIDKTPSDIFTYELISQ